MDSSTQKPFIVASDEGHYHLARRKAMLSKYSDEIRKLQGNDPRSALLVFAMVGIQIVTAIYCSTHTLSIWAIAALAYLIGGFAHQSLFFAVHEIGHNLVFSSPLANRALSFVANLPLLLPMAISFRKYHNEHHIYLGIEGKDPDLPTRWEVRILAHPVAKAIWAFFQVLFYVLRPALTMPRAPSSGELLNWAFMITFDVWLCASYGWRPVLYCLLSSLLGSGYHPAAGHFIAEHYVLDEPSGKTPLDASINQSQETFSYYGALNYIMFNGGWHVEHHDHPSIPCWRLPMLHKIAPEFYGKLKSYDSWTGVVVKYVLDKDAGPHCRVVRSAETEKKDE